MKILLTGGASGGHFYPLMAVADDINRVVKSRNLIPPKLYFMSVNPYDQISLRSRRIKFIKIPAGKIRIYFSLLNIFDFFKTIYGVCLALWKVFWIFPDVVFSKGGHGSFPALIAARFFRIPVVIHESDTVPGRVNAWASKFASRIAISYPETSKFFDIKKTALVGQPIRKTLKKRNKEESAKMLGLSLDRPVIVFLGGSQGAEKINDLVLKNLSDLLQKYEIIHQTGKNNFEKVLRLSNVIISDKNLKNKYHIFDYLSESALALSAGVADVIISRAGSSLFEIASWKIPSIIIPISNSHGNHQRKNAYSYMRAGAGIVIEENNLSPKIFLTELNRIINNKDVALNMMKSTDKFFKKDAGLKIAVLLVNIALEHE